LFFNLHGVLVSVELDHDEARALVGRRLAPYRVDDDDGPRVDIDIRFGAFVYPTPLHAKRVLRYGRLRNYYWDGVSYFTDYFSTLIVSAYGCSIQGHLSPETIKELGMNFFVDLPFTLALFEALRFHGLYYVHSAALVGPDGTGYLVSGNCGSGKTSLTLALIQAGFKYLSDDTVFMKLGDGNDVTILGFARDFHVPADLVDELPSLSRFRGEESYDVGGVDKIAIPAARLSEARLDGIANPSVLVFTELSQDGDRIEALGKEESMSLLLRQSPSVTFHPTPASSHLEALKRVVTNASGFQLLAGPGMKGDPDRSRRMIERAREMALMGRRT